MNCKPNQLAYVRIPEGAVPEDVRAQINGMPVFTVRLMNAPLVSWEISPGLPVIMRRPSRDIAGNINPAGKLTVHGLPDQYLVPIGDGKRPEQTDVLKERETT